MIIFLIIGARGRPEKISPILSNIDRSRWLTQAKLNCARLQFSIHNADGGDQETVGRMMLADDNAARAFGKLVIRDLIRENGPPYAGWIMQVANGAPVCSIPFSRNESLPTHLDNVGKGRVMEISPINRPVVLIVEDDFLLRMNAAEMIGDAGFDVVEAANAEDAIAILEARPDIHVVFTDVQMPGSMDGLKLARFVRGRWPRSRSLRPPASSASVKAICRKAAVS